MVITGLSLEGFSRYRYDYFKQLYPFIALLSFAFVIDLVLGRQGFHWVVLAFKLFAVFLVGQAVFNLSLTDKRRLIIACVIFLLGQYAFYFASPGYFSQRGRSLGFTDAFSLWGTDTGRVSLAYMQANVAAYSILNIFLAGSVLFAEKANTRSLWAAQIILIGLAFATGGRGVMILIALYLLARFLISKSGLLTFLLTIVPVIVLAYVPIESAINKFLFLRQESNLLRLHAMANYVQSIYDHPFFGVGYSTLREAAENLRQKPSHFLPLELLAGFGVFVGSGILIFLTRKLAFRAPNAKLTLIGIWALLPGLFSNTVLLHLTFFGLLVPFLLDAARREHPCKLNDPRERNVLSVTG